MGAVTEVVKRRVPASYRAMIGASGVTDYYSLTQLQALSDYVQWRLFSTVVGATNEASDYSVGQQELLGILTTLRFIPVAVDFWGSQTLTESVEGPNENVSYPDRRPDLWKIFDELTTEAQELSIQLGVNIASTVSIIPRVSYGDNGRDVLVTPDPQSIGPAFGRRRWDGIPLGPWGG